MTFDNLLTELKNGKTFESMSDGTVECIGNIVYEDEDLHNALLNMGAEIMDYGVGYALISTNNNKWYEIPYKTKPNRFGDDLLDETIIVIG